VSRDKKQFIYTGIGWHKWDRDLVPGAEDEIYEWLYLPLGYRCEFLSGHQVHAALDICAKFMIHSQMNVILDGDKATADIGSRPGIRLELPIACALDEGWELKLTPWYEYSAIGKSPNFSVAGSGGFYEPASTNRQYGINVGLQYSF